MKTVFSNRKTVQVWHAQSQPYGRGPSILFEGPSIFSYGKHFEMARILDSGVVLITTRTFSATTTRHLSFVHRETRNRAAFCVPTFDCHGANLGYLLTQAQESLIKAHRARTHQALHQDNADQFLRHALAYEQLFPSASAQLPSELHPHLAAVHTSSPHTVILAHALHEREAEKITNAEALAARKHREADDLAAWLRGEERDLRAQRPYLRVRNGQVETSHNASVPVSEARKLYRALRGGHSVVGYHIGNYVVRRQTLTALKIGCHYIPMSEIDRIAPELMQEATVVTEAHDQLAGQNAT